MEHTQREDIHQKADAEARPRSKFGELFLTKKFLNYTGIGILISAFNVFLLWLFIDVCGIPTVTAGVVVTGVIFVTRYLLLALFKIL